MQLGQTPKNRQVNSEDLSRSLYEISIRLPNTALEALYQSDLGSAISKATRDQVWWFRRTEWLVKRPLTYRLGDWARVYASLDKHGFKFDMKHDYRSVLLLEVLLELGAELGIVELSYIAASGSREVLALVLSIAEIDPEDEDNGAMIISAVEGGNIETLALLLEDGRIDPAYDENVAIRSAVAEGHTSCVELLLADKRVDPSEDRNETIHDAIKYRFYDIFDLLIADKRIREYAEDQFDGFGLEQAILQGDSYFVRRIIEQARLDNWVTKMGWAMQLAAKIRDSSILKLILELARDRIDDNWISASITQAKIRKYDDIVEILERSRA